MKKLIFFNVLLSLFCLSFCFAQNLELTYIGATKKGTLNGLIPEWSGGLKKNPQSLSLKNELTDPYFQDKVIDIISQENISDHESFLSFGLQELLKKNNGFKIYLYPSRRSLSYPKEIKKILLNSEEKKKYHNIKSPQPYYIPFTTPKSGLELIENHLLRFQGGSIERNLHVFPVRSDGTFSRIGVWSKKVYQDHMSSKDNSMLFYALARFTEPRSLKGDILLVHEPIDFRTQNRSSWIYSAAQRRVRRAPDIAHDGIGNGSEGMITADQVDGFNGSTDRYNWTLLEKKILIIPYNTYKIGEKKISYKDIIKTGSVNPSLMRFEHHRVWVVKAILKKGMRHIYKERVFYIDEDSWAVVMEEIYTKEGDLWRVALHGLVQSYYFNIPFYRLSIYHDLYKNSYLLTGLDNSINKPIKYGFRGKNSDFQPNALRRMGSTP